MKEKCEVVQAIDVFRAAHKGSCHQACAFMGISQVYYAQFKKVIKMVDKLENGNEFILYKINGNAAKDPSWASKLPG